MIEENHTRPIMRRRGLPGRLGVAVHGRPDHGAMEGWLGSLGQLRSPATLDRAILDEIHHDVNRSPRTPPVLVLGVTLCCVMFGAVVEFRPAETTRDSNLAKSTGEDNKLLVPTVRTPEAPVISTAKIVAIPAPTTSQATEPASRVAVSMRPREIYQPRARSVPPLRGLTTSFPNPPASVVAAVAPLRLAKVTPPAGAVTTPILHHAPVAEVATLPARPTTDAPLVPATSSLSWSGTEFAAAPIKLNERLNGMVSPTGLLAGLPQARDNSYRPVYKRAWFVGMLGVAATGIAAGVTAAVVSSQQTPRGTSGQPITVSLGPT